MPLILDYKSLMRGSIIALSFATSVYRRKMQTFHGVKRITGKGKVRLRYWWRWRWRRRAAERSGAKCGGDRGGDAQGVTGCRGLEITAGQAILSVQEQKDDPPRRITRDAPRCPVKLIREMLFNGNVTVNTVVVRISGGSAAEIFDAI